jgi:hypothetical protein
MAPEFNNASFTALSNGSRLDVRREVEFHMRLFIGERIQRMLAFPLLAIPLYVLAAHLSAVAYLYRLWPNIMRWLGVHLHCKDALEDILMEIVVPIRSK